MEYLPVYGLWKWLRALCVISSWTGVTLMSKGCKIRPSIPKNKDWGNPIID